jgi:hypothetical protein
MDAIEGWSLRFGRIFPRDLRTGEWTEDWELVGCRFGVKRVVL